MCLPGRLDRLERLLYPGSRSGGVRWMVSRAAGPGIPRSQEDGRRSRGPRASGLGGRPAGAGHPALTSGRQPTPVLRGSAQVPRRDEQVLGELFTRQEGVQVLERRRDDAPIGQLTGALARFETLVGIEEDVADHRAR